MSKQPSSRVRRSGQVSPVVRALIEYRKARSISLEDAVFSQAGLSRGTLERLESGQNQPNLDTLERYASAVGFTLSLRSVTESPESLELRLKKTRILAMFNHAGGVGKTSLTRDIGYLLQEMGFRVLLVDLDGQANLSAWMGLERPIANDRTAYGTIAGEDLDPRLPEPVSAYGVDIIPSNLHLATIDGVGVIGRLRRLQIALRKLTHYDFVILDAGPSLANLSSIALTAADELIVPMPVSAKGLEALPGVLQAMERIKMEMNPTLKIGMFILTQFDAKTAVDQAMLQQIQELCSGVAAVSDPLGDYTVYREAIVMCKPVPAMPGRSKATEQLRLVAAQLLVALNIADRSAS
jgi:chromosome partitioning protein